MPGSARNRARTSAQGHLSEELGHHLAYFPAVLYIVRDARRLPEMDRSVSVRGCQALAVRTERHAEDIAGMALEGRQLLAGRAVPDSHGLVGAAGRQALAVRAEPRGPCSRRRRRSIRQSSHQTSAEHGPWRIRGPRWALNTPLCDVEAWKAPPALQFSPESGPAAFSGLKPIEVIERVDVDRIWRMIYELQSGIPT